MKIRVLGCSGAIAAGCRTTAFLLDHDILIDAGSGVGDLSLDEMVAVDHILLSHSHLDHVLAVPLLADSVMRRRAQQGRPPVQVYALPQTLAALRTHVLNGVIWPDFTRLPSKEHPVLEFLPVSIGQVVEIGGRRIEVLSAEHTVPAVGYAVEGRSGWWVYTGDTGPNPTLWARLADMSVAHLVIETAFGDEEHLLARVSRHLCPAVLGKELKQLDGSVNVHITHIKPGEQAAVMSEVRALVQPHRIHALEAGQELSLD